jgi:hypothetical protein
MIGRAAFSLAAVVLAQAAQPSPPEALAALYGRTLGAAAECKTVTRGRLEAAAEMASARLKALARDAAAQSAAGAALAKGIDRGTRDVLSGAITCTQAETEFGNLERDLAASR